ncbi:MAG: hypothetical protein PF693_20545 [Spirochaetia bacterium]|jgi:hypothetical protein|nr:hypothetical protein [Spirochaetia bacterium]
MRVLLMIYSKIFHKQFLLIFILLLSGCISNPDNDNQQLLFEPVLIVNEQNTPLKEDNVVEIIEIELPFENIDWMVPEIDKLSTEIYLPEVVKKKKEKIHIVVEHSYIPSYSDADADDYEYGWNYVPESNIDKEPSVVSTVISLDKEIQEDIDNNNLNESESKKNQVITEQNISTPVFEKFDIFLDGKGWIYLPDNANSHIEYNGRKFTDVNTIYTFFPEIEGNYLLRFQYQDLSSDIFNVEEINLKILKPSEVVKENIEILPDVPDEIDLTEIEILDLESKVNKLIFEENTTDLAGLIPDILISEVPSVINNLPEIAELLYNSSYFVNAASILETLIKDNSITSGSDYYLYLLGNIYEKDSSLRNEQKSAIYYKTLIDNYPSSIYWDDSQDRYRFLKRRYIDIR